MCERAAEQPALIGIAETRAEPKLPAGSAAQDPIAQVLLESPVPHLDRPFDYAVPADMDEQIMAGARVKVPFSGREMTGWVLKRSAATEAHRLALIRKVVTPLPLLTAEVLELCSRVAERYAGVTADVLRAAVPQRVAGVEKEFAGLSAPAAPAAAGQPRHREAVLAMKSYGPQGWPQLVVSAVQETHESGEGTVVVLPDQRDVDLLVPQLEQQLGAETIAALSAGMGPTPRYRSYLRLRFGQAEVAVGTRSAVFAPVSRLGRIIVVDDDDPSHQEPRAPYQHSREVALLRSVATGAGIQFISTQRSLEVQRLVERGWLTERSPERRARTSAAPLVTASADSYQQERDPDARQARLPQVAYRTAREGLARGPVLVQVGRTGFIPAVRCQECRARQQCPQCHGPLALPGHFEQSDTLRCRWCGLHHRGHRCAECGSTTFRAGAIGADRTAQELGRAFPNIPVISSTGEHPVAEVQDRPALVVSTPGVEPAAENGYAAALLLDGDAQLAREGLDVPRRVLGRWFRAASLVRPRAEQGAVVVTAEDPELTGALVRWDPAGYARRELYRRLELNLPPAVRMLSITGQPAEAGALLREISLPAGLDWVGPAPAGEDAQRWLLFFSYAQAAQLVGEISRARRTGSAQHTGTGRALRIAVDDAASLQF